MPSPDDILAYKAMQEEQNRISAPTAGAIGAGIGALAGVTCNVAALVNVWQVLLVQLLLGGAAWCRHSTDAIQESPAAKALAKMQAKERAGQPVTPEDMKLYEMALADAYNSQLGIS